MKTSNQVYSSNPLSNTENQRKLRTNPKKNNYKRIPFNRRLGRLTLQVTITTNEFDPWTTLAAYNVRHDIGATATFVGTMRDYNKGDIVKAMFLEHYPSMTEKYLHKISEIAFQRWDIIDTLIIHRVGDIQPGDNIVLIAVWAGHRAPAFDACRFLIEELKFKAPFWKCETLKDGTRWIDKN